MDQQTMDALAASQNHGSPLPGLIVMAVFLVFGIAVGWRLFVKAGEPGWAAIVPIYNIIVLLKIAGKPAWWFILFLIPIVSLVITVLVSLGVAKSFGKGTGFGIGLWLLAPIFYAILAFGDAKYQGAPAPAAAPA